MEKQYNPNIHHRRSIRFFDYDYSQDGLYFITICVQNKECLFGEIDGEDIILNEMGQIANDEWLKTEELRKKVQLHDFVVMPNHFHAILEIVGTSYVGALRATPLHDATSLPEKNEYMSSISPKSGVLGSIVRAYKSAVTMNIHLAGYDFSWQRNYYEHIIRDCNDYGVSRKTCGLSINLC